jgi:hypothetical protein
MGVSGEGGILVVFEAREPLLPARMGVYIFIL